MIVLTPSLPGGTVHGFTCMGEVGNHHLPMARHCTLAAALNGYPGEEHLWLDADIEVTSADIDELRRVQKSTGCGVVSGWYPRHDDGSPVGSPKRDGFHGDHCDMVEIGFGCVLIQPWVYDALRPVAWMTKTDRGWCPAVFASIPNDPRETAEDYHFSRRCEQAWVRIVAATNVVVRHHDQRNEILPTFVELDRQRLVNALRPLTPAGSPCIRRAEPALISERTAS